jgi:hypothetical protein
MLKGEIINQSSGKKHSVSFFDDDSIETVRQKIGAAMEIHHDRLFILVGITLPGDYYNRNPQHWEGLFERISYNNEPLETEVFNEYQINYRSPPTSIPFNPYDKTEWMSKPEELQPLLESPSEFTEYRIFGVEPARSFVLLTSNFSNTFVSKILPVKMPIPENNKLFTSFYEPSQFVRFVVIPYVEAADSTKITYFPLLQPNTPSRLSDEVITLLTKSSVLLDNLLKLDVPEPEEVSIIRTRFYIPLIETDFGSAVRTRFEQIFYGLTVSKDVPCITLFTGKEQTSRHKFFTETPKTKKPFLDMSMWSSWWSIKPSRNIPSLVLFRGKTKHHYDRITITANDIVMTTHRPEGNNETPEQLERQLADWIKELDAIVLYVDSNDIQKSRWELQDMSYLAKYKTNLEEFNLLRFKCLSNIFDIQDKTRSQFNILRTEHSKHGLGAIELKILQMKKEVGAKFNAEMISAELSVPIEKARELIRRVEVLVEEKPHIIEKAFRGYPTIQLGADYTVVSSVSNLKKSLQYANLLRYVLTNPSSDELDKLCPKRVEKVSGESTVISTVPVIKDAVLEEGLEDLFDDFNDEETPEEPEVDYEQPTESSISTSRKQATTYNYFKSRLQKFDPETFDPSGSQYPKKCEQKHQPIILNDGEVKRLEKTPYNIKNVDNSEEKLLNTENPDGVILCPEYWCMRDQIPLSDAQLKKEDGEIRCPICNGKLQTRANDDPRDFPLIKRENGFVYPGYVDYKSPKTGRYMPCCFKRSRLTKNTTVTKNLEDKYYVLGVDKSIEPDRIAFLPPKIIKLLHINETYELFQGVRRLTSPNKGFFRTGMGRPSQTLPELLGLPKHIKSPRESVETVLKCSFVNVWRRLGTQHLESIQSDIAKTIGDITTQKELAKIVSGIDEAFNKKELSMHEELEYVALLLNCDVFRIDIDASCLKCAFYNPLIKSKSRGIIVLEIGDELSVLAYTERKQRGFMFKIDIHKEPFTKEISAELEKLRSESCVSNIPSYNDAIKSIQELLGLVGAETYQIILDPFGRGQALYVPQKLIIPFQNIPLPDDDHAKISGYKEVSTENLPEYESMKELLKTASKYATGLAYKETLTNKSQIVEILLVSGLRIPVQPVASQNGDTTEVLETVRGIGESELVFGEESAQLKSEERELSYSAEVYEFLLFQLTKDLETDYKDLAVLLREVRPNVTLVKPTLEKWFSEVIQFVNIEEPKQFLSKIRKPCDESCSGELCGWDGKKCKVQINMTIKKDKLFHRLLSTLIDNSKIRSMILDGRTTPFFSTILYLELPNETIRTDNDLPN